jgi:2-polyprenyl-6-methoxyphenol hydroxylase-like FAD-dependent oxidoreductase
MAHVFPTMTSVMIVGGGPVGLTLSILLSGQGVDHFLVEAHPGTARHPKARGISARSMEIFRRCGVEQDIRRAGLPADQVFFYRGRTLIDPDFERTGPRRPPPGEERSPSPGLICSQDALEPVLLRHARQRAPHRIRFACPLVSFTDDGERVRVVVEDRISGTRHTLHAQWLVGCDGATSTVRSSAGVVMQGPTGLGHFLSVCFQAPLGEVVADRASAVYFVSEPGRGGFMAIDNDRRWIYHYPLDPLRNSTDPLTDHDFLAQLIRTATGIPQLQVTIQDTMTYRMDAQLASAYRSSRVLLAGDAAHVIPPTGGHGMNTGIGDADNLAWKLAAVTTGRATNALLDTYQAERRPIAQQIIDLSLDNACARGGYRIDDELLLSATYRSTAIIPRPDASDRLPLDPSGPYQTSSPGDRAPHVRLAGTARIDSTLDLIGPEFTLITPSDHPAWQQQAATAAAAGIPVTVRALNTGSQHEAEPQNWHTLCGIPATGAVLVRPDGHIAWTAPHPTREDELLNVLRHILASR